MEQLKLVAFDITILVKRDARLTDNRIDELCDEWGVIEDRIRTEAETFVKRHVAELELETRDH
jgi:hypothetical protein